MSLKFIKNKEDFVCDNCSASVVGDGFTNHCPKCLYSKHVDVYPGDRAAECGALMKPTEFVKEKDEFILTHTCTKCGHMKRNKMSPDDDFDVAVSVKNIPQ